MAEFVRAELASPVLLHELPDVMRPEGLLAAPQGVAQVCVSQLRPRVQRVEQSGHGQPRVCAQGLLDEAPEARWRAVWITRGRDPGRSGLPLRRAAGSLLLLSSVLARRHGSPASRPDRAR